MKKYAAIVVLLAGLASAGAASATSGPSDAEMERCFKAHAQLMEKPALRTWANCWRVHGYLMDRG